MKKHQNLIVLLILSLFGLSFVWTCLHGTISLERISQKGDSSLMEDILVSTSINLESDPINQLDRNSITMKIYNGETQVENRGMFSKEFPVDDLMRETMSKSVFQRSKSNINKIMEDENYEVWTDGKFIQIKDEKDTIYYKIKIHNKKNNKTIESSNPITFEEVKGESYIFADIYQINENILSLYVSQNKINNNVNNKTTPEPVYYQLKFNLNTSKLIQKEKIPDTILKDKVISSHNSISDYQPKFLLLTDKITEGSLANNKEDMQTYYLMDNKFKQLNKFTIKNLNYESYNTVWMNKDRIYCLETKATNYNNENSDINTENNVEQLTLFEINPQNGKKETIKDFKGKYSYSNIKNGKIYLVKNTADDKRLIQVYDTESRKIQYQEEWQVSDKKQKAIFENMFIEL